MQHEQEEGERSAWLDVEDAAGYFQDSVSHAFSSTSDVDEDGCRIHTELCVCEYCACTEYLFLRDYIGNCSPVRLCVIDVSPYEHKDKDVTHDSSNDAL